MKKLTAASLIVLLVMTGCVGVSTKGERQARKDLRATAEKYRPQDNRPELPKLTGNSGLDDYLRFAMLNQPRVEAAYYDWAGAVNKITVERSLPDPQITFESDIAEMVMTVMPGIMQMFPGPGKLKAAARVATAESEAKYFAFESTVLQTAFALKKSYYDLYFLDETIRVNRRSLSLLADLEQLSRAQSEVGKMSLQNVYRTQIEQERLATEIANMEDSRRPMLASLKGALGISAAQPDPPVPVMFESTLLDMSDEQLWSVALTRNPRLKMMEAEVRMADASIKVAHKSKVPDFSIGLMADAKAAPTMFRPLAGMTLPIWRDKIAAEIARAQSGKRAAQARLSAEEIMLAVEFAEKRFMLREADRNLELLRRKVLPKAQQSLDSAHAGYRTGMMPFADVIEAERMLLDYSLMEIDARKQRELALAELSLMIAGVPPAGAPLLDSTDNQSTTRKK